MEETMKPSEPGRYGTYITNEPQQYTSSQISSQHQSRTSHAGSAGGRGSTGGYSQPGDMIFHPGSIVNSTGSGSVSSVSERTRAQGLQAAIGSSASYAVQHNSNEQRPIVYGSTSKSGELVEGRKRKKANPFKKLVEKSKEKMEKLGRKTK
ncbi:hypothetical protein Daus18300_014569 [Diaporthe australafricana]|uniref:Uncharacterized protein n=1 Tax=Diaporthe australafricana TaxID=127596 RepID=A0ABR3VUD6_9PEZI